MVIKKNIIVKEIHDNGKEKVVYEGEDKRFYNKEYQKEFFGIPFSEWVKMIVFVVGALLLGNTYMERTDNRIKALEVTTRSLTEKLTETSQALQDYMAASDVFHSSVFGQQFKAGRPIDGNFKKNFGNNKGDLT